jgi:hypothetical protein
MATIPPELVSARDEFFLDGRSIEAHGEKGQAGIRTFGETPQARFAGYLIRGSSSSRDTMKTHSKTSPKLQSSWIDTVGWMS